MSASLGLRVVFFAETTMRSEPGGQGGGAALPGPPRGSEARKRARENNRPKEKGRRGLQECKHSVIYSCFTSATVELAAVVSPSLSFALGRLTPLTGLWVIVFFSQR